MVKCEICNLEFTRITGTHLKSHGITTKQYKKNYPQSKMSCPEFTAIWVSKVKGKTSTTRTLEQRKKASETIKAKYASDSSYRERVSLGTKNGMNAPNVKKKMKQFYENRDITGENNPFFGRHHTQETKRAIGDNEERNKKIANSKRIWWAKQFDAGIAILFPRGRVGRYKGKIFRSLLEYSFYKHLETEGYDLETQIIYEPVHITYELNNRARTYTPDFLIGPLKTIVEIKPSFELSIAGRREIIDVKCNAGNKFCKEKGLRYTIMTEKDFPVIHKSIAACDPDVVWIRGGPK